MKKVINSMPLMDLNINRLKPFRLTCLSILMLLSSLSQSQAQNPDSTIQVNKKRLSGLVIGSSVAYTGSIIGLNQVWYSNFDKQSFHFFNDASEWKQTDKVGHFYSAFQISSVGSQALQWSGVAKNKSDKMGALTSFVIMSSIEALDGFSAGYGASASDLVANAAGSAFFLGQNLIWNEVRIYPKFSFHQTAYASARPDVLGAGLIQEIVKDYNGQTYWLSVDMDKFARFPKWINIAVGYGAEEMIYASDLQNQSSGYNPQRQFYLSLDFDLTSIKSKSKLLNGLLFFANMIKLPSPALAFSKKSTKAYALYF